LIKSKAFLNIFYILLPVISLMKPQKKEKTLFTLLKSEV